MGDLLLDGLTALFTDGYAVASRSGSERCAHSGATI
jgi:hypothetical protein